MQLRFWKIWQKSGAIKAQVTFKHSFLPMLVTNPPPTPEVTKVIDQIIEKLNALEIGIKKRIFQLNAEWSHRKELKRLEELLEEVLDARYQTHLCEYYIAKEYLGHVLPEDEGYTREGVIRLRILEIFSQLEWCIKNDRRSSYCWLKIPPQSAPAKS